jgi:type I restriction enzyme R subunit
VKRSGWDIQAEIREEVSRTICRVIVLGRLVARGKAKRADCLVYRKPKLPPALIAKEPIHRMGDGMRQAPELAEMLGLPFAYSSNDAVFLFGDRNHQAGRAEPANNLYQLPSNEELWRRFRAWKGFSDESARIVAQDYYTDSSG